MEKYIGFDIDDKKTVACVVQKGKKDRYDTMRTDVSVMRHWLEKQRKPRTKLHLTKSFAKLRLGIYYLRKSLKKGFS